MTDNVVEGLGSDPVMQFSVYLENKVGRLRDFTQVLANSSIHILAMTVLDTTEGSIVRLVVDDPDQTKTMMDLNGYSFNESLVLAVELDAVTQIPQLLSVIHAAEINVDYLYPFIFRPKDKSALVMHLEDIDMAADILTHSDFRVLAQGDISR